MATPIPVTQRLSITPLVEIENPVFARFYAQGLYRNLYESGIAEPLDDLYLPNVLKSSMQCHSPQDHHKQSIIWLAAYALGMIHAGVLRRRDGTLRPEATALVKFTDPDYTRGYQVAREFYFIDAQSEQERLMTDAQVIEQMCEIVREYPSSGNDPDACSVMHLGASLVF